MKDALIAGKIAARVKNASKKWVKEGVKVSEFADKVENEIRRLKAAPAFPVNISFNECAAHDTARVNDERVFSEGDVVKVDLGVHVNGWIGDTAYTVEISSDKYKELIKASKDALLKAQKIIKKGVELREIGRAIQEVIKGYGFRPIFNLGGHPLRQYEQHGEFMIPNYDNGDKMRLEEPLFAVEPFATNGEGYVKNGNYALIYNLVSDRPTRSRISREILSYIKKEYKTLPFAERWIAEKFKLYKAGLRMLVMEGILHQYPLLIEKSGGIVSQHENTMLFENNKLVITTSLKGSQD